MHEVPFNYSKITVNSSESTDVPLCCLLIFVKLRDVIKSVYAVSSSFDDLHPSVLGSSCFYPLGCRTLIIYSCRMTGWQ